LEHGPGLSVAVIAQELGVSQAALFRRVGTKEELLVRALSPRPPAWIARIADDVSEAPVRDQLFALLREMDASFREMMPCIAVLSAAGITPHQAIGHAADPVPAQAHRALSKWFARLAAAKKIRNLPAEDLALAILGALQSRHMLAHALGERAPKPSQLYLEHLVEVFWQGMDPRRDMEHVP
jgi:AcrR family transcriptional regulator